MHRSPPVALLRLLALSLAAVPAGCRQDAAPADPPSAGPVANAPAVIRPNPTLDRPALLALVAQAASAAAAGAALPAQLRGLDGRQFEMRLRFGCRGPAEEGSGSWLSWTYDSDRRTIRVVARPTISAADPLVARLGGEETEAAEGFWIPRPWLLQPVCPAAAAVQAATTTDAPEAPASHEAEPSEDQPLPTRQRVGIAQFYSASDPRTGRRDRRPYESVYKLGEGEAVGSQGFNLVLSGRLRALPGGGVIQCVAAGADAPPDCIISAEFQRAWIERPETGQVIAEWGRD